MSNVLTALGAIVVLAYVIIGFGAYGNCQTVDNIVNNRRNSQIVLVGLLWPINLTRPHKGQSFVDQLLQCPVDKKSG